MPGVDSDTILYGQTSSRGRLQGSVGKMDDELSPSRTGTVDGYFEYLDHWLAWSGTERWAVLRTDLPADLLPDARRSVRLKQPITRLCEVRWFGITPKTQLDTCNVENAKDIYDGLNGWWQQVTYSTSAEPALVLTSHLRAVEHCCGPGIWRYSKPYDALGYVQFSEPDKVGKVVGLIRCDQDHPPRRR